MVKSGAVQAENGACQQAWRRRMRGMTMPVDQIAAMLRGLSPAYAPTPLLDLPALARRLGVAQVLAKDEGERMLGSFKSLGGTYAGLRALSRAAGLPVEALLDPARRPAAPLPPLVCASDGNHGLAVAMAARLAGAGARVFLHGSVPPARERRIAEQGAEVVRIAGTYDDAVDAAAMLARQGGGILVADTAEYPADPVVADVMAGYGVIAAEVRAQVEAAGHRRPTHLSVQAGVGGLAAAMAEGLAGWMAPPARVLVAEPEGVACVGAALAAGHPLRLSGSLDTVAEMLSCGEVSAPALAILRRHGALGITASEAGLAEAPAVLRDCGGPASTPSGTTGLAALLAGPALPPDSRVLLIISEAALPEAAA
jgi:diaminopropionate ammonia-lyase